jgi:hypothetical protein
MTKPILITICFLFSLTTVAQEEEKIKYRKLNYNNFTKYSINDTSAVIIDIFFDKKDNSAISQMSFLPITLAVVVISPTISAGLTVISLPLFMHGSYTLIKYRKKKLYKVLTQYKETGELPHWLRKKANKQLDYYEKVKIEY